jgi:hypothetical protein
MISSYIMGIDVGFGGVAAGGAGGEFGIEF